METNANRGQAGPSAFSRPPQPRTPTRAEGAPRSTAEPFSAVTVAQGAPESVAGPAGEERTTLEGQRRSGAQWFYWIAALSLINTIVAFTGQDWRFIIGLGITELVREVAAQSGGAGIKAGVVGLLVIGMFAVLGQRAVQGYRWAFLVGLVLYGLDGAIFLLVQDWVGVGFHAFALIMIGRGYVAARQLSPAEA